MQFKLDINLTEDDYLEYNLFHAMQSNTGKKQIRKSRIFLAVVTVILIAIVFLILGCTFFSITYAILLGLFMGLYILFLVNVVKRNIKSQIKKLKKTGKLPFDAVSRLEFHEDKIIEITDSKRIEQGYEVLERICIVGDRFVYLYYSSIGAFILPVPQIKNQIDQDDFLNFLFQKCNIVEYY